MTTLALPSQSVKSGVNWKQVGLFTGLTMLLSWLVDLVVWRQFGYSVYTNLFFQLQMLIPAAVAIGLQRYAFPDSPLYYRNYRERPAWFFRFYLFFTAIFVGLVVLTSLRPELYPTPLASIVMLILVISMLVLLGLRLFSGKDSFRRAGLSGGRWWAWLLVWGAILVYDLIQIGLNMVFKLGARPDLTAMAGSAGMDVPTFLVAGFINTVAVGPLLGLLIAFGEEYGWRGYLQGELVKLGRLKGVLLVGVVWGVWHAPAVAMGHNYPGYPVLGPLAFLVFNLALAVILGYIMLKSGSVWLAAFAHAVLNAAYAWLVAMVYTPNDPLFSFGAGVFGIACTFGVVLLLLRDPVWQEN